MSRIQKLLTAAFSSFSCLKTDNIKSKYILTATNAMQENILILNWLSRWQGKK